MLRQDYDERADVFSFALIMWEVFSGRLPLQDLQPQQAAAEMAYKGLRPERLPAEVCPPRFMSLMERCWDPEPQNRPLFPDIVRELEQMCAEVTESEARMRQLEGQVAGTLRM